MSCEHWPPVLWQGLAVGSALIGLGVFRILGAISKRIFSDPRFDHYMNTKHWWG